VIFETQDYSEWRAHLHRLRAEHEMTDASRLRADMLCVRLARPTTYRLSVLVPNTSPIVAEGRPEE
jgi:hypothetical protein